MKKNKLLTYILIILSVIIGFYTYELLKFNVVVEVNNPQINELLNVEIELKSLNKHVSAEEVEIEIFNIYKKDEKIDVALEPYEVGKYKISYLPQYSGNYVINVTVKKDNQTYVQNREIEI